MSLETLATTVLLPLLALAGALAVVRLFRGPSLPDRVVALDLLSMIGIAVVAVFALAVDSSVFFDIAVVIAMVSFMATVAFAKYVEKRYTGDTFSNVSPTERESADDGDTSSEGDTFKNVSPDPDDEEDDR